MTTTPEVQFESQKTLFGVIHAVTEISDYQIRGLLCSLFESANPVWLNSICRAKFAPGLKNKDFVKGGKMQDPACYFHPNQIIPTTPGCSLILDVDHPKKEGKTIKFTMDMEALKKGLHVMAQTQLDHWCDFVNERDDMTTADIFGQCVVYGEVPFCC